MRRAVAALAVALVASACGQVGLGGSPSLTAAAECAAVVPLRDAWADASRAAIAMGTGNDAAAAPLAASAKSKSAAIVTGLPASTDASASLRAAIEQATTSISTFGDLIASGERAPVTAEEVAAYFGEAGQAVATVEAIATAGWNGAPAACPGIEPIGIALPTLVPRPAGTVETQQLAVLAELRLAPAVGVRFDPGARLAWTPGFVPVTSVTLDNGSGGPIAIPMELTVLRWDGAAWRRLPCQFPEAGDPAPGLCGATNTNVRVIAPGGRTSATDPELVYTLNAAEPGTYALVLPVWHGSDEYPDVAPTEAAVAIVTVTTSP